MLKVSPVLGVSEMYISCSVGGAQRIGMERGVVSGRAGGGALTLTTESTLAPGRIGFKACAQRTTVPADGVLAWFFAGQRERTAWPLASVAAGYCAE